MKLTHDSPWLDFTAPLSDRLPVWPDNPEFSHERKQCLEHGDDANVSRLATGTHTGTHIDGLNHFIQGGLAIDEMPLDLMVGHCLIIEVADPKQITAREIAPQLRKATNEGLSRRVFFKTANSRRPWYREKFDESAVHFSVDAARLLADSGVELVGLDYLSVGGFGGNVVEVHHTFLGAGMWCVEGLWLGEAEPGTYEVACLPIRLEGGDAGLARVIGRKVER
ncbi:cyclase family protein [Roseibacillus persicicus]|uniref:cyclase family protein n=1 Tax=Roseibacillus persicicus TaxID=454148 RepID=UPI00398B9511